jgi:hypothetical protein
MAILPQKKLLYRDTFNSPPPNIFYPSRITNPSKLAVLFLLECLKNMLRISGQPTVHIIIDAIDECPKMTGFPSPREKVLKLAEELVNLHVSNLRICVTSRPEADIISVLGRLAFRSVSLHGENGQIQDIAEYIKSQVRTDFKMRAWRTADKELVIDVLTKRANGM